MKEKYFDIVGSGYSVKCKLYCAERGGKARGGAYAPNS